MGHPCPQLSQRYHHQSTTQQVGPVLWLGCCLHALWGVGATLGLMREEAHLPGRLGGEGTCYGPQGAWRGLFWFIVVFMGGNPCGLIGDQGVHLWASWRVKDHCKLLPSGEGWGSGVHCRPTFEWLCLDCRSEALQVVLDAASGSQADTRNKAVRLIANKLFAQPQLQDTIATFARQMLFKLTATAATAATAAAPPTTAILDAEQARETPLPRDPSAAAPASQVDPSPTSQQQQQQHQYQSEEDGTRFAGLFCALCTKQQTLLRDLLLVYGRAAEGSQAAIEAVAAGIGPLLTADNTLLGL